jgi:hypothetical protein
MHRRAVGLVEAKLSLELFPESNLMHVHAKAIRESISVFVSIKTRTNKALVH